MQASSDVLVESWESQVIEVPEEDLHTPRKQMQPQDTQLNSEEIALEY
jgi:hypothetical protein